MVRVDKTAKEWMDTKPYSRWDSEYWHPKYDEAYDVLNKFGGEKVILKNILRDKEVISCDHVRASKQEKIGEYKTAYFTVDHIMSTGYDLTNLLFVSDNAYERLKRTALRSGDVAIAGSGKGSVGKSFIFRYNQNVAIVGDLFILRVKEISPYYLQVFLQSFLGQAQVQRHESGVSGQTHINKQEIEEFLVPILSEHTQTHIESEYKKMSVYHDKAMEAKKKSDEVAYKKNIETAEKMLKDLIARTEAVIRGEQKDVI